MDFVEFVDELIPDRGLEVCPDCHPRLASLVLDHLNKRGAWGRLGNSSSSPHRKRSLCPHRTTPDVSTGTSSPPIDHNSCLFRSQRTGRVGVSISQCVHSSSGHRYRDARPPRSHPVVRPCQTVRRRSASHRAGNGRAAHSPVRTFRPDGGAAILPRAISPAAPCQSAPASARSPSVRPARTCGGSAVCVLRKSQTATDRG